MTNEKFIKLNGDELVNKYFTPTEVEEMKKEYRRDNIGKLVSHINSIYANVKEMKSNGDEGLPKMEERVKELVDHIEDQGTQLNDSELEELYEHIRGFFENAKLI
mgnify:FL=1|tara:strand:+ start:312 stop:626 length:315 start_codon:yes stop_codon:yes gene_type:complete